jgi:hypothetical protein
MIAGSAPAAGGTPLPPAAAPADIVGISRGHPDAAAAEHWVASLPVPPTMACTHLVQDPYPHVAISLTGMDGALSPVDDPLRPAADAAAAAHRTRSSGRAFVYPGMERLVGTRTVAELLDISAIDRVHVLGGTPVTPDTVVETGDYVRPQWMGGLLTLVVTPVAGGRVAPFEVPHPTPCCAAH